MKKETLAERLKQEREIRDMSQRQFGQFMGIHYSSLAKIEITNEYTQTMAKKIYEKLGQRFKIYVEDVPCKNCGKEISTSTGRRLFCSDKCSNEYFNKRKKKELEYYKNMVGDENKSEPVPVKGFAEFMNGRSYGDAQREMLLMKQKEQRMRV